MNKMVAGAIVMALMAGIVSVQAQETDSPYRSNLDKGDQKAAESARVVFRDKIASQYGLNHPAAQWVYYQAHHHQILNMLHKAVETFPTQSDYRNIARALGPDQMIALINEEKDKQ